MSRQDSHQAPRFWLRALQQKSLFPGFIFLRSLQNIKFQLTPFIPAKAIHFTSPREVEEYFKDI